MVSIASTSAQSGQTPYQVGGSLSLTLPSYVYREADRHLPRLLLQGEFCYVLNSRQMGKSSLLVHTLRHLEEAGRRYATLDITSLGSQQVTAGQWYRGIVADLWRSLGLFSQGHYKGWWEAQGDLSPAQKLRRFFQEVLLEGFPEDSFVILIDEIDSILSLSFPLDDFFALIRYCYNQRAIDPQYCRLTFGVFGVATPRALICDRQRTPFNIGQPISLDGFQFEECGPLLIGLQEAITPAPMILQEILRWTGGQPFLTHKLCALIWQLAQNQARKVVVPTEQATSWVARLVHDRLLHQWESQDEPEHLRTIRDRLLRHPERIGRLLGRYQQILRQGQIPHDDSEEASELQLAGLVRKVGDGLQVKNPIYRAVFDAAWVAHHLSSLRPYSQALTAWLDSDRQDASRLLRGQALRDAQQWTQNKRLSDEDYQFLAASVESDLQAIQTTLEAERSQAIAAQLQQSRRNARLQRWLLGAIGAGFILSTGLGLAAWVASQQANRNEQIARESEIQALLASARGWFDSRQRLDALLQAVKAHRQLKGLDRPSPELAQEIDDTLKQIIFGLNEKNRFSGHAGDIRQVVYRPDGRQIASTSLDGTVKLWSPDGTLQQTLTVNQDGVRQIAFSPSGKILATGGTDLIQLWQVDTGKVLIEIQAHQGFITSLAFSPDGQKLLSGSVDKTAKLWQLDGTLLQTLTGHQAMVRSVVFSPDGQAIASASADATIKLWNQTDGRLLQTLTGHDSTVTAVLFTADSRLISASTDNTLKLWSMAGELIRTFSGHQAPVTSVQLRTADQLLASVSEDDEIRFWRLNGEPVLAYPSTFAVGRSISFSPDGKYLVASGRSEDRELVLWQLDSPFYSVLGNHQASVIAIAIHPDGNLLASAGSDAQIKLWRRDGTLLKTIDAHRAPIIYLTFSPDGQQLASSSFDGTVRLWDPRGELLSTIDGGREIGGRIDFHPEQPELIIGGNDGAIYRWRASDQTLEPIPLEQRITNSAVWHPNGAQIALSGTSIIQLIDSETAEVVGELQGHRAPVRDLEFNRDGTILASSSIDQTAQLWNTATGENLQTLAGHTDVVWDVTFAPENLQGEANNLYLATGSADQTIKLWLQDGTLHTTLTQHTAKVLRVVFSPDAQYLFSASNDKTIIRWDIPAIMSLEPADYACQWLQDYLQTNPLVSDHDRQICNF
ncbi:MAG: AAA-like domain-containing protein [Leptolyngbyaceae cyanobacterium]